MRPFRTIDEQIQILKKRNMIIDVSNIDDILIKYGYYNIINGYKDFFLEDNSENYIKGVRFSDVYNLFVFDKTLRHITLTSCEEIETSLKTSMAYVISKNFGVYESEYLSPNNYDAGSYNPKTQQTDRDYILSKLTNASYRDYDPFKHYREDHGHIPPWILLNSLSFGMLHKFFKLQKSTIKSEIINTMLKENNKIDKRLFNDLIYIVFKYRNQAAHLGRLYNYNLHDLKSGSSVGYNQYFHSSIGVNQALYRKGLGRNDYYTFISAIRFLDKKSFNSFIKPSLRMLNLLYFEKNSSLKENIIKEMGFPSLDNFKNTINYTFWK